MLVSGFAGAGFKFGSLRIISRCLTRFSVLLGRSRLAIIAFFFCVWCADLTVSSRRVNERRSFFVSQVCNIVNGTSELFFFGLDFFKLE